MIVDRRSSDPIARLRPIPGTDRFELLYLVKYRWLLAYVWQLCAMKLMLESAREIVESDPIYRVPRAQ